MVVTLIFPNCAGFFFTLRHPHVVCERTFQEAQQNTDLRLPTRTPWRCFGHNSVVLQMLPTGWDYKKLVLKQQPMLLRVSCKRRRRHLQGTSDETTSRRRHKGNLIPIWIVMKPNMDHITGIMNGCEIVLIKSYLCKDTIY